MTLRSRKKPPTTVLKPTTALSSRPHSNSKLRWQSTIAATVGCVWLSLCPASVAQTTKPTWSAQRSVPKVQTKQPKRSLSSAAVQRSQPKRSIGSTLLAPHDVNRKSFVPTPRPRVASHAMPETTKQPVAKSVATRPVPQQLPKQPAQENLAAPTVLPSQPSIAAKPKVEHAPKTSASDRVAAAQRSATRIRNVATSRQPLMRTLEMPTLRPTPKKRNVRQALHTAQTKVRQPGSLKLVQFEDELNQSDGVDFDSDLPDFFDLDTQAEALPADREPVAPEPASGNIFDSPTPTPESNVPSDTLFRDQTPPERMPEPTPSPTFSNESAEPLTNPSKPTSDLRQDFADKEFSKPGSELQAEIDKALGELPPLPTLGGDENDLPIPPPANMPKENPLGDESDNKPADSGRDLSYTNGRDCQASGEACSDELAFLRRREQTDMSIDITPSIEPREFDMSKVDEVRVEKLADCPSHTWTDRNGQVIADGKFEDYRFGKIIVRTVNGTMRSIPDYKLSNEDRCFVNAWWELPDECHFEDEPFEMRDFRMTTFTWTAAATCHKPLYFEQPSVERYGHTAGPIIQPLASGAHFFGDIIMYPYHAGLTPPNECVYPLGHYRPGDCAPWIVPGFPMTTRGFKWEAMALGAGIALLP